MAREIIVSECFARDGLQNEDDFVPTRTRIDAINRFAALGCPRVEATSYSNPKVVPQFADAVAVLPRNGAAPEAGRTGCGAGRAAVRRPGALDAVPVAAI